MPAELGSWPAPKCRQPPLPPLAPTDPPLLAQALGQFGTNFMPASPSRAAHNFYTNSLPLPFCPVLSPQALSQFGTDFSLISHLFPGRQRRHLKNKFNKESRANPGRVDAALRASASATINSYKVRCRGAGAGRGNPLLLGCYSVWWLRGWGNGRWELLGCSGDGDSG